MNLIKLRNKAGRPFVFKCSQKKRCPDRKSSAEIKRFAIREGWTLAGRRQA